MKTVLLDVLKGAKVIEIQNQLEAFCDKLDCRSIDIVDRRIGWRTYAVMCGEESLSREPQMVSAINEDGKPMFVGNLMFFNRQKGELSGLSKDDIDYLLKFISTQYIKVYDLPRPTLTNCEF
jgi:hypothetical protein